MSLLVEKLSEMILSNGKTSGPVTTTDQAKSEKPVHASFRLLIPPNKWQEALSIFGTVVELTKLEKGCINCRLYQDLHDEGALKLEQVWKDQIDLERHLRSDRFRTVLLVIDLATEYPEIRFDVIESTSGMETIQRVRV
jgi:quinol monooxygenase YgiN